jgi:two-component system sensor histidine kinase/response regulator
MTGSPPAPETVVVIDDDYAMRLSCQQILTKVGYRVETFEDGSHGLAAVGALKPGLVVVDLKMPGLSGLDVIARLNEIDPTIIVVVITGYATIGTAVEAMKAGAYDFLPKPFSPDELRLIVNRGFDRRRLQIQTQQCEVERELLKRRFVTFVSHQLKTPLVAVHQYLDVLARLGEAPETAAKRAEWIQRCLTRTAELQRIINDWLTLAQLEGGTLTRQRVRVDLKQVVPGILATYEALAASNQVTVGAEFPEPAYAVRGDATCLSVLFDNLITNAIKYNRPGGRVCVRGALVPGEVVVVVEDTGVGIPESARPFLFDEFFRVRTDGGKKVEGTGLGLPICKRIVAEMGGAIQVSSVEHEGSTFEVRLPAFANGDEATQSKGDA